MGIRWLSCLLLLLPMTLQAAPVYSPGEMEITLGPGERKSFSYTITADGAFAVAPYMWYEDEGLPNDWIGPLQAKWHWFASSASQTVTLDIPDDAEPGTYRGRLLGFVSGGAHSFQRGDGVKLTVTVGADCAGAEFIDASDNDFELWAPNHSTRSVELFGDLHLPVGCSILAASYEVIDEYGEYSGSGELEIVADATGYRATPLVEVSRRGNDKDGREYTVILSVETEAGIATHTRSIVVLHDRRDKADDRPINGRK